MKIAWPNKPLAEVCEFQRGLTYSKGDEVERSENVVLRATNIDLATNLLDLAELRYINDKVVVPPGKKVRKGSLLICTASGSKSHLGKIAYIDRDYGYAFGGFMGMITPSPELLPKYLFHLMTSGAYKDFIDGLSDGANINNLKLDDLGRFPVPIPPLAEQRRIVGILDEAFAAIATAKANAEKNLRNARGVFESQLAEVFGRSDGEWSDRKTLEDLTEPGSPITYGVVKPGAEGDVAFVRGGDVSRGRVLTEQLRTITKEVSAQYKRTLLRGGELLISLVGQPGQVAVAPKELAGANIARQVGLIRLRPQVNAEFVRLYLQSSIGQGSLGARQQGSVQQVINLSDLRTVPVPIPSPAVQLKTVEALSVIADLGVRLEALYRRKSAAFDDLKKSLLHYAFSGQLTGKAIKKPLAGV
ncbi:MAG: restriction endonuclease subunit S [Planctomycetes bacterium]|nr:restriction endonuclease subunit S [Planctomycetota bacterium]